MQNLTPKNPSEGSRGFIEALFAANLLTINYKALGGNNHFFSFSPEKLGDHPALQQLAGRLLAQQLEMTVVGTTLVSLSTESNAFVAAAAHITERHVSYRLWEELGRSRGGNPAGGKADPQQSYLICSTQIGDGSGMLQKLRGLRDKGYPDSMPCLIVFDRGQGGVKQLRSAGYPVSVIFDRPDVLAAVNISTLSDEEQKLFAAIEVIMQRTSSAA